jgi:hypothetical protein
MNKHETLNMNHETPEGILSPHFKLREFVASRTAEKHGIANVPSEEAVENLRRLCEGCLEPLREALGLPVVITSGFRTKALNDLLAHSSSTSQHMRGEAADFYVKGHTESTESTEKASRRELLVAAFKLILIDPKIDFDQMILYPNFIHVSYVSKEKNRHGILLAQGNGKLGYGRLTLANALKLS